MNAPPPAGPKESGPRPLCWTGDHPAPNPLLAERLEQACGRPLVSRGAWIPARWHPVRRQLAYLRLAAALLAHRREYSAIHCVQQFIGLYACALAGWLRLRLPPLFLQPFIYVPRPGLFGRLWQALFSRALANPALKIAFCHSPAEIEACRRLFPGAAAKFRPLHFAIEPIPGRPPAAPPYLFSSGTSCRDYATLFAAARLLPPDCPPVRVACKPADVAGLNVPANVSLHHDLWAQPYRDVLAAATLVIVPLQPLPVSAGQIVFAQAMSAERPVVATCTPAAVEFLGDACAWLVPPQDAPALAQAIQAALASPAAARAKAAAARALFEERHSPAAVFAQCAAAIAAELAAAG